MKHKITLILLAAFLTAGQLFAQQTITVNASNADISDNLDLEAVAYLFGEAKNLEQFEKMLNDPEKRISNLDLNRDGYVDYLRVIESNEDGIYVVVIQAVLGEDIYQDVATIDVDARKKDRVIVQVIGNEYIYGPNYVFEPVYVYTPLIYSYFWYPHHVVWYSPYYWHYYPRYYHYRKPHRIFAYHRHIYNHYHKLNCHYVPYNRIDVAVHLHKKVHRNDYEQKHPEQAFNRRNADVQNRRELTERRSSAPNTAFGRSSSSYETKSRKVISDWENTNRRSSNSSSVSINQNKNKSASVNESRRSSNDNSGSRIRTYSSPAPTQKSSPVVSKSSSARSSSNNDRSVSRSSSRSSSNKSSSSVSSSHRSSPKPSVSSTSSNRSSRSPKSSVQKSSSKPSSKSSSSSSSSRSSSSKSSSSSSKTSSQGRR